MTLDYRKYFENLIVQTGNSVLEQIRARQKALNGDALPIVEKILTCSEKRTKHIERILHANCDFGIQWSDDNELVCPICGAKNVNESKENLKMDALGLGRDEQCWACGAEPEHHDPFYRNRFTKWEVPFILDELVRVDGIYESETIMTRDQIAQNREYFGLIVAAMCSANHDYRPNRYEEVIAQRTSDDLFIRVIQLAMQLPGGDISTALDMYGDVSRDIVDLYTIINDLKRQLLQVNSHKSPHFSDNPGLMTIGELECQIKTLTTDKFPLTNETTRTTPQSTGSNQKSDLLSPQISNS